VTVIAQAVVGPYETVQLHSTDPNALQNWLSGHGYVLPADVQPIVNAYVAEGFDFLALRLVPGENVSSMRPIRITSPGAGLSLPLRMVAAGTGATTVIKLWVFGEGRYEPFNMPTFHIDPSAVSWDWATNSSNMAMLRKQGFDATNHAAWLVESAGPMSRWGIPIVDMATYDPVNSGYGSDPSGTGAPEEAQADLDHLFGTLDTAFVTRLDAELAHAALANDLSLGATTDQSTVSNVFYAMSQLNVPTCPPKPTCPDASSGAGDRDGSSYGFGGSGGSIGIAGGGCSTNATDPVTGGAMLLLAGLGVVVGARRRRRAA
jgi:MYXO-CTERM domain-containing protein